MNETPPNEVPMEGDYESPEEFFRAVDMGRAWFKDSSLEKWFPFTARELTTLRERVRELEANEDAWRIKEINITCDNLRQESRIRDLEEAMPDVKTIEKISNEFGNDVGDHDHFFYVLRKMASRIESVMTKHPSEK